MREYIVTQDQFETIAYAVLRDIDRPITEVVVGADKLPEIVRCRDCKHMHTVKHWLGMDVDECWLHADRESGALGKNRTEPDGFCAWGERRES